jgi:integrase
MATLYKRPGSAFYYAQYFDASGKRVSKSTGTTKKREGERIAADFESEERKARASDRKLPKEFSAIIEAAAREAANGELTLARAEELIRRLHQKANPDVEIMSLEKFWRKWIAEQRLHVSASTATGYDHDLDLFIVALGKRAMAAPPNDLTKEQITAALIKARKATSQITKSTTTKKRKAPTDRRATTVNKALSSLRRVMDAAIVAKLATANPAKLTRALRADDSILKAPFTQVEVRAMLDHPKTSDQWKGAILIAAHTGLRMGDIIKLSDKHIDGTRIVIKPSKTAAKTGKVITVPLTPPCIGWIGDRTGDFFPEIKTQKKGNISNQFEAIRQRAGVAKEIEIPGDMKASRSFHSLRHTFASWLAEADVHADVRQKLTGHSSSKIHQRYTHHDEALDRAVGTLPTL